MAQRLSNVAQQTLGLYGPLNEDSKWCNWVQDAAHIPQLALVHSGRGTTETTKNHIAGKADWGCRSRNNTGFALDAVIDTGGRAEVL